MTISWLCPQPGTCKTTMLEMGYKEAIGIEDALTRLLERCRNLSILFIDYIDISTLIPINCANKPAVTATISRKLLTPHTNHPSARNVIKHSLSNWTKVKSLFG